MFHDVFKGEAEDSTWNCDATEESCFRSNPFATHSQPNLVPDQRGNRELHGAALRARRGKNGVMISLHKNYTEYSRFVREQLPHWVKDYDTMLISLKGIIAKPLSLRYLAEEKSTED